MRPTSMSTRQRMLALVAITAIVAAGQILPALASATEPAFQSSTPAAGDTLKPSALTSITVTYDTFLRDPSTTAPAPNSTLVVKDKTNCQSSACDIAGQVTLSADRHSMTWTPSVTLNDTMSPLNVHVKAEPAPTGTATYKEFQIKLDGTAPAAPSISAPAAGSLTNANLVHVKGSAEPNSTVTVAETSGATMNSGPASNTGSFDVPITLSDGEDKVYSLRITATDGVGNVGNGTLWNFHHDSKAPNAPAIDTPSADLITQTNSVTFSGTSPENGTVLIMDGATQKASVGALNGAWSQTVNNIAEGAHDFTVKLQDTAGNVGAASAIRKVTVDQTQPAVPTVNSVAANLANRGSLPVSGKAEPGSRIDLKIDDNDGTTAAITQTMTATADDASGRNYNTAFDVTSLKDGLLTLTVKSTDAAGNSSSLAISLSKDTSPPDAGTILEKKWINAADQSNVIFTGTGEAGATASMSATNGSATLAGSTPIRNDGTFSWQKNLSTLADGDLTIKVIVIDPAGNPSAPFSITTTKDTIAPGAPAITSPTSGQIQRDASFTVSGTTPETGAIVSVLEDTATLGESTPSANGGWATDGAVTVHGEGQHTIKAVQRDAAGNQGTAASVVSFVLNAAAPVAQVLNPADLSSVRSVPTVSALYSETLSDGTLSLKARGATLPVAGATAVSGSTVTFTPAAPLSDGVTYDATTTGTDQYGTTSDAAKTWSFTVDTTGPDAPIVSAPAAGDDVTTALVAFSGTAEPNSTVTIAEGSALGTAPVAADGAWSTSITMQGGNHTVSVTATDAAGNVGAATTRAFKVSADTAAPNAPAILHPTANQILNNTSVLVDGTAEPASTVKVYEGSSLLSSAVADAGGAWSATISFALTSHTIKATATDAAGNVSPASAARTFSISSDTTAPAAPVITAPLAGSSQPALVLIKGTAEGASTVKVTDGARVLGTVTAAGNGAWSLGQVQLAEGSHTLKAVATDPAGNVSADSSAVAFFVDLTNPSVAYTTDSGHVFTPADAFKVTGNATDNHAVGKVVVTFYNAQGSTVAVVTATLANAGAASTNWEASAPSLLPGQYSVIATAYDAAGLKTKGSQINVVKLTIL